MDVRCLVDEENGKLTRSVGARNAEVVSLPADFDPRYERRFNRRDHERERETVTLKSAKGKKKYQRHIEMRASPGVLQRRKNIVISLRKRAFANILSPIIGEKEIKF